MILCDDNCGVGAYGMGLVHSNSLIVGNPSEAG